MLTMEPGLDIAPQAIVCLRNAYFGIFDEQLLVTADWMR